jgi:hypothetical protein
MIKSPLNTHINSRASYLSPADYKDIMQYQNTKPKPLAQLSKKYKISNSRLYQIWRGYEFNRIQWNDLAVTPSMNIMDKQNEANFQNKYDSTITALENVMRDTEVEPSKSTDPASEGDAILGSKAKKTGGKKSKPKSTLALLTPSSIQTQPIQASKKDTNNDNENLDASYEKMVEKSTKILDEKKKRYPENNLPIP